MMLVFPALSSRAARARWRSLPLAGAFCLFCLALACGGSADDSPPGDAARDASAPAGKNAFAVTAKGGELICNDGSGRRFFAAGMVDNRPASGNQLSRYDHDEMRGQIETHARVGATVMRWNTFLKGRDLKWGEDRHVTGVVIGGSTPSATVSISLTRAGYSSNSPCPQATSSSTARAEKTRKTSNT